jgi:hypothetical protein
MLEETVVALPVVTRAQHSRPPKDKPKLHRRARLGPKDPFAREADPPEDDDTDDEEREDEERRSRCRHGSQSGKTFYAFRSKFCPSCGAKLRAKK